MKGHVLKSNSILLSGLTDHVSLQTELVIQSKSALRISTQFALDLDLSLDLRSESLSVLTELDFDLFYNVNEDCVLLIRDWFWSPGIGPCGLHC